jgi:Spy/CpxP family protein refolding chaperone
MKPPRTIGLVITAFLLLALMGAAVTAAGTAGPVGPGHGQGNAGNTANGRTGIASPPVQGPALGVNGNQKYTLSQTLSDQAQETTIAFDGLAFLTGSACSDTFLPPGKVADYAGFQYLRDNDATQMGHNTDFVTRASENVLYILNDDQRARFVALSKTEAPLSSQYAYMRFPLMKAFRAQLEGTVPAGSSGLDKAAVMAYSAQLYDVDASISLGRARTYASVIRSLNQTQRAYLDKMASSGMLTWPIVDASAILKNSGQDNSVAMRTYASEMFAWYAGNVDSDVYFCPERQATYFGSFYMKDRPAMGNPDYSISTTLTGDSGEAFLDLLTDSQRNKITSLVDIQRADLNEIVAKRTAIATELRRPLNGGTIDESAVRSLSARYGELDGEISYYYATHFADVGNTVTSDQKQKMVALRNLDNYVCEGAHMYSQPISMPQKIPSDFLFGVGTYSSAEMSAWLQSQQGNDPSPIDTTPPQGVMNLRNMTYQPNYIMWTWIDPQDADFDRVMVYLNGLFKTNVTKGTQFYNATSLAVNTLYTISTRTVDTWGNMNMTWVSSASRTTPAAPAVSGIYPASGKTGTTVSITNLAGMNFRPGATVKLQKNGQSDIIGSSVVVSGTTKITCKFAIPATESPGSWNVVVTNSDGTTGMKAAGFGITAGSTPGNPTVSGIYPASGKRGTTVSITNLSGSNFRPGATVKLRKSGQDDIIASSVVVSGSTKITCKFAIPATAATGGWGVVVTNNDGTTGMKAAGFSIIP